MSLMSKVLTGLLYPFVVLIQTVFTYSYNICGNYGIALILLSLFITAITAPLYYLAERWKNKEKVVQKKMHKDIKSINENYEGQKRFYLTKAARKIYDYKWWYTFRTSFGLIIQIPFFFAAYEVLSKYSGYNGVSFLFIKDLGLPDNLISGVNVLPFVMTLINIAYSIYYTKSKSWNANKELYIMAGIFLVLLYNSPSALLLYWTMNNVFSFIKGIILRKTGLSEVPVIIESETGKSLKEIIKENINIVYFFFFTLLCSLQVYWNVNFRQTYKYFLIFILFVSVFLSFFSLIRKKTQHYFVSVFIRWIIFLPILLLFIFGRKYNKFISNANVKLLTGFYAAYLITYLIFILQSLYFKYNRGSIQVQKNNIPVVFLLVFWIFIYLPIVYYTSDPNLVNIPFGVYFFKLVLVAFIFFLVLTFIYHVSSENIKNMYMQGLIFIILSFFVYSLILKIDVGQLDFFMFKKEKNLHELSLFFYVLDSIVLAILAFISKILYKKKIKFILKFCIIIPFLLSIVLITKVINMEPLHLINNTDRSSIQEFEKHQLSKTGTNVIFILADMFNGNYMQRIFDEEPEYREKLDGFVWYPDCLSISDETLRSLPGLLGGHSAAKKSLHYIDDIIEQDYKDAIGETCNDLFNALKSNGFEITVSNQSDIKYADLSFVTIDKFWLHENEWRKKNGYEKKINQSDKVKLYVLLGIFQSFPYYLKSILYDDRGWLFFRESSAITAQTDLCISSVVQLDTLSDRSIVVNDKKNTFLFLHSLLPHYPWGINHDGNIISADDDFADTFSISFTEKFAYYSAKKTISLLIKYIDWLKQNGVYTNSVIYVFSDHGNDRKDSGIPISKAITYPDAEDNISWAHTLLLVKDKHKTGMIEINPLYVSSADIPSMLLTDLNINFLNDIDPRKVTIEENKNRTRLFFAPSRTENKKNLYYVKGSIFDPNSWSMESPEESEK